MSVARRKKKAARMRPAHWFAGSMAQSANGNVDVYLPGRRKLAPNDGDTQRFNVDDLEKYILVTGDTSPIEYLASKFLSSDANRQARAIARVEALSNDLAAALASLKHGVVA